ncbi:MAG: serine hydrolase [Zoogloeaceae bacterium]|nr:serine hydrolase [Zoogloeaceae bacterium]
MKKILIAVLVGVMTGLALPDADARIQKTSKPGVQKTKAQKTSPVVRKNKATRNSKTTQRAPVRRVAEAAEDWNGNPDTLGSTAVLVMDQASGQVLLEKNPDMVSPIASISKLMTAMVMLDAKLDLNEVITISEEDVDYRKGTHSRLQVGTSMTRDTALLLALMSSENRAANALGRHYPGGLVAFVAAMNRKARALGLRYTYFEEPTGLSSNNVSTPRELSLLTAAAHQYSKIREYSTMAQAQLDTGLSVLTFNNTNALIKSSDWRIGLSKTGYISEAGRCLVMQAWVSGKPVVMVLLDATGKLTRASDAARIKRWMEDNPPLRNTGA